MSENKLFWHSRGCLYLEMIGDQTKEEIQRLIGKTQTLLSKHKTQLSRTGIIVDLRNLGRFTAGGRALSASFLEQQPIGYVSVIGNSLYAKYLVTLIANATGRGDRIRYFTEAEEAWRWALQGEKMQQTNVS